MGPVAQEFGIPILSDPSQPNENNFITAYSKNKIVGYVNVVASAACTTSPMIVLS